MAAISINRSDCVGMIKGVAARGRHVYRNLDDDLGGIRTDKRSEQWTGTPRKPYGGDHS